MAGHFVLNRISHQDLQMVNCNIRDNRNIGVGLGPLQHAPGAAIPGGRVFPGWTDASIQTLTNELNGQNIGNRAGLPPHRYITIPGNNPDPAIWADYLRAAQWIGDLVRPGNPSFGTTALIPATLTPWNQGDK